ncbi:MULTISPECIES: DUF4177 domain-containing protein [Lysinibacillus]|uniref:DUF4177 domain-containing protein n=1 Tax=Lysinibacillus antri TaxID=2498145 RepID=A0A432LAJ0_9BACI|nr:MULTISPECIES: DUF4177 domain-containing protein [Lysinibacillus]RUL51268.1 DUF4177 domain-containing protein [Lysinibacillus antri]TSI05163.1 DUF4177 domain-containing protein [Lysinibacillus sp. BW-2-10]
MYEHKFIKVRLSTFKLEPEEDYHQIVYEHEREGWELVQIFAPGLRGYGTPTFFELIFKRRRD